MKHGWFSLLLVLAWMAPLSATADLTDSCDQDPYRAVARVDHRTPQNACDISAQIEASASDCSPPDEEYDFEINALEKNLKEVQMSCEAFCEDIDTRCGGDFSESNDCNCYLK